MSDFEKIFQTNNPIEFDHIASVLEAESVEYFTSENTGIFDAMPLEQISVRTADAPDALRSIARALILAERPDLDVDSDEDLARGLRTINSGEGERTGELAAVSRPMLLEYFVRIVLKKR
ncbi:MAG: hypothetical protein RIF32_11950 [Leptospirales bacterium]|jgi:hypothetical protein